MCCFIALQTNQESQANVSAKTVAGRGDVKVQDLFENWKLTSAWVRLKIIYIKLI